MCDGVKCAMCGGVFSPAILLRDRMMARLNGDRAKFWRGLISSTAGVLEARARMSETLACSDEEYAYALANLEVTLEIALLDLPAGLAELDDADAGMMPELAFSRLIMWAAARTNREVESQELLSEYRRALVVARRAVERVSLPWAALVERARPLVVLAILSCPKTGEGHG